jgi:hypothetical protein
MFGNPAPLDGYLIHSGPSVFPLPLIWKIFIGPNHLQCESMIKKNWLHFGIGL